MPDKEVIKGIKERRNVKNNFYVAYVHYTADDNKATQEWFQKTRKGMPKAAWEKEYEINPYALSGQRIWPEFDPNVHIIKPFEIPKEWTRIRGIDYGQFNPTCCLWGAVDYDGTIYIYKEYYQGGRITASTHARKIAEMSLAEDYYGTFIDPSTLAKNQTKELQADESIPYSVFEIFIENGVDVQKANNDLRAGWDQVSDYLQLREYSDGTKKPKLYIFNTCENLNYQIPKYRYQEQSTIQASKKDPDEKQIKKEDHACDALRYLVISQAPIPEEQEKELTFLQKDLRKILGNHKDVKVQAWSDFDTN